MNLLAIDLATRIGFASQVNGIQESGFVDFTPHPGEQTGWRYIRFNVWLYGWKDMELQAVVIERAIPSMNRRQSTEIAFGLSTRVEEFCARQNAKLYTVHNATLKKWATGDGTADKQTMIYFARQWKRTVTDDNEADALHLFQYAKKVILKGKAGR